MTIETLTADLVSSDGTVYPLSNVTVVGSSSDCDLRIGPVGSDIAPFHAIFRLEGLRVTICKLSDSNITLLNGESFEGIQNLENDASLQLGERTFKIKISYPRKLWQDAPGAWGFLDSDHSTIVLSGDIYGADDFPPPAPRESDSPHIIHMRVLPDTQTIKGEWLPLETDSSVDQQTWEIGRDPIYCQFCFPEDPNLSGRHAVLSHNAGIWRISKLFSTNPLYVNGNPCVSKYLTDRDVITLGRTCLTFYSKAAP